ncbi:hypothetical protein J4460_01505 [Candidatus Woesearchaeota archaeon]|nr:MAG: hypothetical protein QS99_C0001G0116 [archaeon GW2011_AR4]MBS3129327.1 hypothetical protein [Candidatus Woesearchaeota archaeon]HIH38630.1 hypothetical protein [Candidatus Woesearchaeota archaeon]HIH49431.1 hypothetical protein [Candidatus Woesearchaeota archaeon]HIJ02834.1 hypothetical protein [Candidatus Woesearchaeota archaeon]
MKKQLAILGGAVLAVVKVARAHCPLCTLGAAAAAGGAAYLGVDKGVIGIFIGAFAVSMGWWVGRMIKKQVIPYQIPVLIAFSFLTTIIPLVPLLKENKPLLISLAGGYGTLLNRTYVIDMFIVGSLIGGAIMCITPSLSKKITSIRQGKTVPYQGIMVTFLLLILAGLFMQFVL